MAFELKVSEPKVRDGMTVRAVKRGNLALGTIEAPKLKPGERPVATYWMSWHVAQLAGNGNVVRVNHTALRGLSTYGVKRLGLRLEDGSTYQAPMEKIAPFFSAASKFADVPFDQWEVEMPPEEERVAKTMAKMRVAGRRGQSSVTASRQ